MAYNNGFPIGYQPYYPQQQQFMQPAPQNQPQMQQSLTPPTIHAEIVQVDNEQVAESYPMSAGTSQMMIAKNDSAIYVKTMYANGQYNLDVFVKRPRAVPKPEINTDIFVTRDEFEARIKELLTKKEVSDEEGA